MYEIFLYRPGQSLKTVTRQEEVTEALLDEKALLWLDITDVGDVEVDLMTQVFKLHPLTIEDVIMPNARPKIQDFGHYLFLVMFSLEAPQVKGEKLRTVEFNCCLGQNFLITAHSEPIRALSVSKERVMKQSPMIQQGADFLLYSIIDYFVDCYFPIIDAVDNMVDEMSDDLFQHPSQETLKKIYYLKNEIIFLRRTLGPQIDVIGIIGRGAFKLIHQSHIIYFRNINDNLLRLNEIVGTSRDIVTGAMETYVSITSNRLNEVMKTLTVMTTTMMPLTLIASIYGMNFKHMPELSWVYGYPAVLFTMVVIVCIMINFFKRRKWL